MPSSAKRSDSLSSGQRRSIACASQSAIFAGWHGRAQAAKRNTTNVRCRCRMGAANPRCLASSVQREHLSERSSIGQAPLRPLIASAARRQAEASTVVHFFCVSIELKSGRTPLIRLSSLRSLYSWLSACVQCKRCSAVVDREAELIARRNASATP